MKRLRGGATKGGRPRVHQSDADRQRAYRAKQKAV